MSNFFVAFITPVLLAKSSSAIYFLFGTVLALGIGVSTIYMPETRGRDLETIGEAFGMHSARDMPVVLGLKRLVSRATRVFGLARSHSSQIDPSFNQGTELQPRS